MMVDRRGAYPNPAEISRVRGGKPLEPPLCESDSTQEALKRLRGT